MAVTAFTNRLHPCQAGIELALELAVAGEVQPRPSRPAPMKSAITTRITVIGAGPARDAAAATTDARPSAITASGTICHTSS